MAVMILFFFFILYKIRIQKHSGVLPGLKRTPPCFAFTGLFRHGPVGFDAALHIRVLVQIGVTRLVGIIDDGGHAFDGGQRLLRHIAQNHLSVAAVQRGIRPIAHFAAEKRRLAMGADI